MKKWDKNSPPTSTCEDFLASTIAISGVRCYTVTTPDPGYQWESDKLTEDTTNESQEVSPFPAGDHEAQIIL